MARSGLAEGGIGHATRGSIPRRRPASNMGSLCAFGLEDSGGNGMARYARVFTQFWTDEKIVSLTEDERTLFLYLLTCPHGNMIGAFVLPSFYGCADLRWPADRYEAALKTLLERRLVKRDEAVQLIWLPNYLKHNPLENPSQTAAAQKVVEELPRSELLREVAASVRSLGKNYLAPLIEALENRCVAQCMAQCPPQCAAQTPAPVTVSVTVTEKETHMPPGGGACAPQECAKTASPSGAPTAGKAALKSTGYAAEFERFWKAYPRKVEKATAFRKWQARVRAGIPVEDLVAAAARYADHCRAKGTEERFIKHAATFLGPDKPYEEWLPPRGTTTVPKPKDLPAEARSGPTDTEPADESLLDQMRRQNKETLAWLKSQGWDSYDDYVAGKPPKVTAPVDSGRGRREASAGVHPERAGPS